jgi:hypothetical protein
MARRRLLRVGTLVVIMTATFVRIRHEGLGWGGYWYIELVPPWHR